MKFAKMVSAAAVAFAALAALGATATASAAPNDEMSVLVWRVVDGPYPNDERGLQNCRRDGDAYKQAHGKDTGCLLEADSNQYFLWANL